GYSSNPRKQALFVMPRFTEEAFTLTVSYKDMSSEPVWLSVYDKQQGYIPLGQLEDKMDGRWKETTFVVPAAIHPAREGFFFNLLPVQEPHDVCVKVPTWWINQYLGKLGMDQAAMMTMGDQTHELELLRQELLRKQSGLAQAQRLLNSRLIRQAVWIKQLLKRVLRRTP